MKSVLARSIAYLLQELTAAPQSYGATSPWRFGKEEFKAIRPASQLPIRMANQHLAFLAGVSQKASPYIYDVLAP